MQPTIICTAPTEGMICLNGRFAGEVSKERPLFAPVSPFGALYIEYRPLTAEECFEYVVDASGNESGIHLALHIVRKMGTIILKSTYAGSTNIDMSQIPVGEITVVGSRCGPFEPALKLLKEGKVQFPTVELYDLKDFEKAFSSHAFKAGFSFNK